MADLRNESPRLIYAQQKSGRSDVLPSGALLRTSRRFDDFLDELGAISPDMEGIHPSIQPVAVIDSEAQAETVTVDTGVLSALGGTQDFILFGGVAAALNTTDFQFLRLNFIQAFYEHAAGVNETVNFQVAANFPSQTPPGTGQEVINLLNFLLAVPSGEHRFLTVPNAAGASDNDYRTMDVDGFGSAPSSVATHPTSGLLRLPVDIIESLRIRVGNADNLTGDQRFLISFTAFGE